MPPARYRTSPQDYMYNTETKRHIKKSSKQFEKAYIANPAIFVETAALLPPINVPATVPDRVPEPPPPMPAIGNPLPQPERQLTRDEIDRGVTQRAQQAIRDLVETELKDNPGPYKNQESPEMERLLRQFIISKLEESTEAKKSKAKPAAKAKKSKFVIRKPQTSEEDDDVTEGTSEDD